MGPRDKPEDDYRCWLIDIGQITEWAPETCLLRKLPADDIGMRKV